MAEPSITEVVLAGVACLSAIGNGWQYLANRRIRKGNRPARDIVLALADAKEKPPRTYTQLVDVAVPVLNPQQTFILDLPDRLPDSSHIVIRWTDANGSRNTYDTVENTGPAHRVSG